MNTITNPVRIATFIRRYWFEILLYAVVAASLVVIAAAIVGVNT